MSAVLDLVLALIAVGAVGAPVMALTKLRPERARAVSDAADGALAMHPLPTAWLKHPVAQAAVDRKAQELYGVGLGDLVGAMTYWQSRASRLRMTRTPWWRSRKAWRQVREAEAMRLRAHMRIVECVRVLKREAPWTPMAALEEREAARERA